MKYIKIRFNNPYKDSRLYKWITDALNYQYNGLEYSSIESFMEDFKMEGFIGIAPEYGKDSVIEYLFSKHLEEINKEFANILKFYEIELKEIINTDDPLSLKNENRFKIIVEILDFAVKYIIEQHIKENNEKIHMP